MPFRIFKDRRITSNAVASNPSPPTTTKRALEFTCLICRNTHIDFNQALIKKFTSLPDNKKILTIASPLPIKETQNLLLTKTLAKRCKYLKIMKILLEKLWNKWENKDKKFFIKLYRSIQLATLMLTVGLWYFLDWKYGLIGLAWLFNNAYTYETGSTEICIDECETGYPCFGIFKLLRSWCTFIPLACLAALIIFIFSLLP